jgi:hypothetical protein
MHILRAGPAGRTRGADGTLRRLLGDEALVLHNATQAGTTLRAEAEAPTDRLDAAPYDHLGPAATARLTELAEGITTTLKTAGAFPTERLSRTTYGAHPATAQRPWFGVSYTSHAEWSSPSRSKTESSWSATRCRG